MAHQPAISFSISLQHPFNRAGGRTSNVLQDNPMELERTKGWLATKATRWPAILTSAILGSVLALGTYTISLLPAAKDWQLSIRLSGVALAVIGLLLWWVLVLSARVSVLQRDPKTESVQKLDADDWGILTLIYENDPKRLMRDEIQALTMISETDVRGSLVKLRDMGYIHIPLGKSLIIEGRPNPNGINITQKGLLFMKEKRQNKACEATRGNVLL